MCFRCTGSIDTLVVAVRLVATCTMCNVRWNGIPLIGRQTAEQLRYKTAGLVKGGHVLVTVVFPRCLAGRHLVWRASRDFVCFCAALVAVCVKACCVVICQTLDLCIARYCFDFAIWINCLSHNGRVSLK